VRRAGTGPGAWRDRRDRRAEPDPGGDRPRHRRGTAGPRRPRQHPALTGAGSPAVTPLLVVEHDHGAPTGPLGRWAEASGLPVTTVRLHAGDPLPPAGACDAAVVLGSEQTAYDDAVPWLAAELAFAARLLAAEVPVLGICFGAQILARVLGARLYRL